MRQGSPQLPGTSFQVLLLVVLIGMVLLLGCSRTDSGVKPGTPDGDSGAIRETQPTAERGGDSHPTSPATVPGAADSSPHAGASATISLAAPTNSPPSHAATDSPRHTEISTGTLLNATFGESSYNPRWFYVRYDGGDWQPTYSEPGWSEAAKGKLMNFRASRAVTNDDELPDDVEQPEANTDAAIANLDDYRAHGVLMLTVGLQTHRGQGYGSAFNPDGSLKADWLGRLGRLIEAASTRGMIIQTYLFFQGHDENFNDDEAIRRGVRDFTDWLIAHDYRNVIIEIANEYNHNGFDRDLIRTDSGIAELIRLAQSRFTELRLPVSASSGNRRFSRDLHSVADVTLIHGNVSSPDEDIAAVAELVASQTAPGPVVMNEDDNTKPNSDPNVMDGATLSDERMTASGIYRAGGSWGMMVEDWNQVYPYQWTVGTNPTVSNRSQEERERDYVGLVLDEIRALTAAQAAISADHIYFPATGHYLALGFKVFWERHGGLMVFGYPLSEEYSDQGLTVQDFERQRFEYHPQHTGTPYEILLARLGVIDAEQKGLIGTFPFQPLPAGTEPDGYCQFWLETGHRLCGGFRDYWYRHGLDLGDDGVSVRESLALFGYPISEEFTDPVTNRTVQYFERARFEHHPDNPEPYRILLTRLGAELLSKN